MEIRDLRAFVTLGDLLHFGQAADRLHVTQSALSKQVQRIESEIGGALFERNPSGSRLTPLGLALRDEARAIVDGLQRFEHRARQSALGALGTLRIGFGITSKTIAPVAISRFRQVRPDVHIELVEMSARHQIQAMRDGSLDVGFCRLPAPEGWPNIPVVQASLVAVVPFGYAPSLALDELVRLPLVTIARSRAPAFHDHVMSYLLQKGLHIQSLQTVTDFSAAVALAEAGVAWAIVPSSTSFEATRVRIKALDDKSAKWKVGLVRAPGKSAILVENFWGIVEAICREA